MRFEIFLWRLRVRGSICHYYPKHFDFSLISIYFDLEKPEKDATKAKMGFA